MRHAMAAPSSIGGLGIDAARRSGGLSYPMTLVWNSDDDVNNALEGHRLPDASTCSLGYAIVGKPWQDKVGKFSCAIHRRRRKAGPHGWGPWSYERKVILLNLSPTPGSVLGNDPTLERLIELWRSVGDDQRHVVRPLEILQGPSHVHVELPYITGTLANEITKDWDDPHSQAPPDTHVRTATLVRDILQAVAHLEGHGVSLSYLRPELFGFLPNGTLVLFDLSPVIRQSGRGPLSEYQSPEMFHGEFHPPGDIARHAWALGVISYKLLTRRGAPLFMYHAPGDEYYAGFTKALLVARNPPELDPALEGCSDGVRRSFWSHRMALARLEPDVVELLTNLLHPDPNLRWSARQALESDFGAAHRPVG